MDNVAVATLAGVLVGFSLGAGMKARAIAETLGDERIKKLMRLLEELEEPPSRK